jgi:excisionase family DNA binding protein
MQFNSRLKLNSQLDAISPFDSLPPESEETKSKATLFDNEEEWLTTSQAASYLCINERTLHNLTSRGEIPYYKFGRRNRYLKSELRNLLMQNKRGSHGS